MESQKQSKAFVAKVTFSAKVREASYLVTELVAHKRKSQKVVENLIMPACNVIVGKTVQQNAVREIEKVSLKQYDNSTN